MASAYACCCSSLRLSDSSRIHSASIASTFMAFCTSVPLLTGFRNDDDLAGAFKPDVIAVAADQVVFGDSIFGVDPSMEWALGCGLGRSKVILGGGRVQDGWGVDCERECESVLSRSSLGAGAFGGDAPPISWSARDWARDLC